MKIQGKNSPIATGDNEDYFKTVFDMKKYDTLKETDWKNIQYYTVEDLTDNIIREPIPGENQDHEEMDYM